MYLERTRGLTPNGLVWYLQIDNEKVTHLFVSLLIYWRKSTGNFFVLSFSAYRKNYMLLFSIAFPSSAREIKSFSYWVKLDPE